MAGFTDLAHSPIARGVLRIASSLLGHLHQSSEQKAVRKAQQNERSNALNANLRAYMAQEASVKKMQKGRFVVFGQDDKGTGQHIGTFKTFVEAVHFVGKMHDGNIPMPEKKLMPEEIKSALGKYHYMVHKAGTEKSLLRWFNSEFARPLNYKRKAEALSMTLAAGEPIPDLSLRTEV